MKKYYYIGNICIIIFEILNVYFIMPMPGSQEMNSIDVAYFLYSYRWFFRILFTSTILMGSLYVFKKGWKWIPAIFLLLTVIITYFFNFVMSADKMFLQPNKVVMKTALENKIPGSRLIIGIENNNEANAYPIEFLIYHHQVRDSIAGKPIIVTYCSVCRTGRVYEPFVNSRFENFRLVGMDHYNAMLEDKSTKSWWRQSTGEAITGTMKGAFLPEILSRQMTLDKWFELYPHAKVMQPDEASIENYDTLARFEKGKSMGNLTRTDTLPWKEKSWVLGLQIDTFALAYDWKEFTNKKIINDSIGKYFFVITLAADGKSFVAFERSPKKYFTIQNDTLFSGDGSFDLEGNASGLHSISLKPLKVYQEFWHSWLTFHPNTQKRLIN